MRAPSVISVATRRGAGTLLRIVISGVLALSVLCATLILVLPADIIADFLTVQDPIQHGGLIYVLGGDYETRVPTAAKLFQAGWAPLIVITREANGQGNLTDLTRARLSGQAVPSSHVLELRPKPAAGSTADEARALHKYLLAHRVNRVILVTSQIHCRRVRMMFHRILDGLGVDLVVRPAERLHPAPDSEVRMELTKLVYHYFTFWSWSGWR